MYLLHQSCLLEILRMAELDHEMAFVEWCEWQGFECLKLTPAGLRGYPDRTVITPWGDIRFEFKTPTGVLSAQQKKWIARIQDSGGTVFVVTSFQQAKERFLEFRTNRRRDV